MKSHAYIKRQLEKPRTQTQRKTIAILRIQKMRVLSQVILFFLVAIAATATSEEVHHQIHLLRPQSGSRGSRVPGLSCLSWRLGVETNNIIGWKTVPRTCEDYVGHYMLGKQYRKDSKAVCDEAYAYAKTLKLAKDGKNIWVFDIDETTLSNLPYFAQNGFGAEPYNDTAFGEWVMKGTAPALPESLKLYKKLLELGIKAVFITGRKENQRAATEKNLKKQGYQTWEKLVLKGPSYSHVTSVVYKSTERKKLVDQGYRIIANIGDQWSDILGNNGGTRTFKLPDPMYYIS